MTTLPALPAVVDTAMGREVSPLMSSVLHGKLLSEFGGRFPTERTVGTLRVVVISPGGNDTLCLVNAAKPVFV